MKNTDSKQQQKFKEKIQAFFGLNNLNIVVLEPLTNCKENVASYRFSNNMKLILKNVDKLMNQNLNKNNLYGLLHEEE